MESRALLLQELRSWHGLIEALEGEPAELRSLAAEKLLHLETCLLELLQLLRVAPGPDPRERLVEWLEQKGEEDLDRRPQGTLRAEFAAGATCRDLVRGHSGHLAWHLGQVAAVRAAAGLPAMPGWKQNP